MRKGEWAIVGEQFRHGLLGETRRTPYRCNAGGRSRRKLEVIAARLNASGDYRVQVRRIPFYVPERRAA